MLKAKSDFMFREIMGERMIVPVGEASKTVKGFIKLNETGALLWKQLEKGCERDDLIALLVKTYDVPSETAARDTDAFLDRCRSVGSLTEEAV